MSTVTATRPASATRASRDLLLEEFWATVSSITADPVPGPERGRALPAAAPVASLRGRMAREAAPGLTRPQATAPGLTPPRETAPGLTPPRKTAPALTAPRETAPGLTPPRAALPGRPRRAAPPVVEASRRTPGGEPVRRATRVTRRGRCALVVLAALGLLLAFSLGRAGSQAASSPDSSGRLQQTTVQPGETLWSVAERIAPKNDPRDVIALIQRLNHLDTPTVVPGEQLVLPAAS